MFYTSAVHTALDIKINAAFQLYKDTIVSETFLDRKGEGFNAHSKIKFTKIAPHYLAIHYIVLLYLEYTNWNSDITAVKEKYEYEAMRKCFACSGIELNDILTAFALDDESIGDPVVRLAKSISVTDIYAYLEGCESYFDTCNPIVTIPQPVDPTEPSMPASTVPHIYYGKSQLTVLTEAVIVNNFTHEVNAATLIKLYNYAPAPGYAWIGASKANMELVTDFIDPVTGFNFPYNPTYQDITIDGNIIRFYRSQYQFGGIGRLKPVI